MKNLESYITAAREVEHAPIDQVFDLIEEMIDQYQAGKQEQHRRQVSAIRAKLNLGIQNGKSKERWARNELLIMLGNVCNPDKVLKV